MKMKLHPGRVNIGIPYFQKKVQIVVKMVVEKIVRCCFNPINKNYSLSINNFKPYKKMNKISLFMERFRNYGHQKPKLLLNFTLTL